MSHPGAISCRCSLTISRSRRRMRLRFTAFPSAFLMLQPNRLRSSPLGRRNTENSRPARRRPSRYTASYSARRTNRHAGGNPSFGGSDARETVAPLLPACREHFLAAFALHPFAEAVLLVTPALMGLIRAFRQGCFSSISRFRAGPASFGVQRARVAFSSASISPATRQSLPVATSETTSVDDQRTAVKKTADLCVAQSLISPARTVIQLWQSSSARSVR